MEDPELAAIRAARGAQGGASAPSGEDQAKQEAQEQMRRDMLATVLDPAARERLARIALVSPDRAQQIEAILLRMVQTGQLRGRVSEEQLIGLLDQMGLSRSLRQRKVQSCSNAGRAGGMTMTTSDVPGGRRPCTTIHATYTLLAVAALFVITPRSHSIPMPQELPLISGRREIDCAVVRLPAALPCGGSNARLACGGSADGVNATAHFCPPCGMLDAPLMA